jgi:hypothetical protein
MSGFAPHVEHLTERCGRYKAILRSVVYRHAPEVIYPRPFRWRVGLRSVVGNVCQGEPLLYVRQEIRLPFTIWADVTPPLTISTQSPLTSSILPFPSNLNSAADEAAAVYWATTAFSIGHARWVLLILTLQSGIQDESSRSAEQVWRAHIRFSFFDCTIYLLTTSS